MLVKRNALFLTLLPLLLLSSCEKGVGESLNEEKNGLGLFQYGEAPSLATSAYGDYCIEDDGTGVLKALENKENVFIVQTADDCSHCQKLEPRLCEFLSKFPVKTFLFEAPALSKASNVKAAFEKIQEVYPSFTFKMEFPRATLVSSSIVEDSFLLADTHPR